MQIKRVLHFIALLLLSVVLTGTTGILGAWPMRTLYQHYSPILYWIAHFATSMILTGLGLSELGIGLMMVAILVGTFNYLEKHKVVSVFGSMMMATTATICSGTIALVTLRSLNLGPKWSLLKAQVEGQWPEIQKQMGLTNKIDFAVIYQQLPSFVFAICFLILGLMLLIEAFFPKRKNSNFQLAEFKVPGFLLWVFMASLFATFFNQSPDWVKLVGQNVMNSVGMAYYLQGLAVAVVLLKRTRLSPVIQMLISVVLVFQHVFMSALGVADFWYEFRNRPQKQSEDLQHY